MVQIDAAEGVLLEEPDLVSTNALSCNRLQVAFLPCLRRLKRFPHFFTPKLC